MTFLIVLVIVLIVFSIWNLISLRDLKRHGTIMAELKDDRYYELKYRLEYITTIIVVVISVGGFFGYRWFEEIKKDAAYNLKLKTDEFEAKFISLNSKITSMDSTIEVYRTLVAYSENYLNGLESKQINIDKKAQYSNATLSLLANKIDQINSKNIIKQDFYIVDNLRFTLTGETWNARYYFKDLTTISGDKLPSFKKPPFLVAVPENAVNLTTLFIGLDYFDIDCQMSLGEIDTAKFSIMISQK